MEKEYQDLWIDFIKSSNSVCEADILDGGDFHRIWSTSNDDTLRSALGSLNSLLNDPKTRSRGLTQLVRFLEQVSSSRWITILDGLTSSIYLAIKSIGLVPAQRFFCLILPNSHTIPELSQLVSSTVVPKILIAFTNSNNSSGFEITSSWLELVKLCLLKYHGPCGNHRLNLEKKLLELIDKDDLPSQELGLIQKIWPLLSQTGGGSAGGIRHSKDWQCMVMKICGVIHETLSHLYGDWCPGIGTQNPFISAEYPSLGLKPIKEKDVLTRITRSKNRLVRLINILCHYLNDPFPAPKPVPDSGILQIIRLVLVINPVELLNNFVTPPKETIYLSLVLPKIHIEGCKLLEMFVLSLEDNILLHSASIEQMFLHQMKWMSQKAESFSDLKITMYSTIETYLEQTSCLVASSKTIPALVRQLLVDIEIRKSVVELGKITGKTKAGKKSSQVTVISSSKHLVIKRNSDVCDGALKLLGRLLGGEMDAASFKAVYIKITSIILEILNFTTSFPSPYDEPVCRDGLFNCLLQMIQNPVPSVPTSLSFLSQLAVHRQLDIVAGTAHSAHLISVIEKLIHPIRPSFGLAPSFTNSSDDQVDCESMDLEVGQTKSSPVEAEPVVSRTDNSSQTVEVVTNQTADLQRLLEHSIQKVFDQNLNSSIFSVSPPALSSTGIGHNNFKSLYNGKRNYDDMEEDVELPPLTNGVPGTKRVSYSSSVVVSEKIVPVSNDNDASHSAELEAMLNDFVDAGPDTL